MARARETERHQDCLEADDSQPLIAIPIEDGKTLYFTSEEAADAILTDETLADALNAAGALSDLSDLSWDEVEEDLYRIRHGYPPPPA